MAQRVEQTLADVEHALQRLDDRTYGTCEICGAPIGEAVLASAPEARFCASHAGTPRPAGPGD